MMESALVGSALDSQCGLAARLAQASDCGSSPCRLSADEPHGLRPRRRVVARLGGDSLGHSSWGLKTRACCRLSAPQWVGSSFWGERGGLAGAALVGGGSSGEWSAARGASSRAGRAHSALASSFPSITKVERTLALPIDYYQILGAESHFLAGSIIRSYDSRLAHPPKEGFSQEALLARAEILRGARDTLSDPAWRGDYNQGLVDDEEATLVVDVPWSKVSGALCLLQEIGEMEVVLQAGHGLLEERLPKTMRRDVVLSMALAYVELSREAMAEAVPRIVHSCDILETALKLLQEEGGSSLAPEFQEQIEDTLEELTPQCVLELLASAVDREHETQREEGLQGLKSILWAVGEGGAAASIRGFTREQFIKDAFSFLTASELISFWNSTPDNVPAESFEVYTVALAHVAEGYTSKKPILIVKADELLWQLQAALETEGQAGVPLEYSLERAMCWLLMGEVDQSMACLGLEEGSENLRDPAVVEFVFSHSKGSEDGDLLPGLCKLLENWLAEIVFPTFRDTEELPVRLGDYYDDPEVITILEEWETTKGGSSSALARIGAALDSIKSSAVQTLHKVFPLGGASGVSTGKSNGALSASKLNLTSAQIACSGIVFGVLVMAGLRFLPMKSGGRKLTGSSAVASVAPSSGRLQEQRTGESNKMDARLAEQVVRKWQTAKARALGSSHLVSHLSEVLEGRMLESWTERVNEVARNGWFWEYRLVGLNIDSVTVSDDGRKAIVEATLQEAARLFDSENPEHKDSYRSTYTTRYELNRRNTDWRITGGVVLRS